jgi:hypothetical protein
VNKSCHYVQHYLLDFGKSLGVFAATGKDPRRGYDYWFDPAAILGSLVTLGLVERSWEGRRHGHLRGVGAFDAASFDPDGWRPTSAAYVPFTTRDRYDAFWATKILMRFTREQLHAVVETAHFSDPRAVEYLTDTLLARQRATGAYWFSRVNPLDGFRIENGAVCFDDLAVRYRFTSAPTTYAVTSFDFAGRRLAASTANASGARTCTPPLTLGSGPDGYTIVEIATQRAEFAGRTLVHVARDRASGELRVIGIWHP